MLDSLKVLQLRMQMAVDMTTKLRRLENTPWPKRLTAYRMQSFPREGTIFPSRICSCMCCQAQRDGITKPQIPPR